MTNNNTVLTTDRLTIRPVTDEDIDFIYKAFSDPKVTQYLTVSYATLEETKEQMQWYKHLRKTNKGFWWIICLKETNERRGVWF